MAANPVTGLRLAVAYYRCSDARQDLSVDRQE